MEPLIEQAINLLVQADYAVSLTGAGISTPSGIPDFRSAESGLWEMVDPMEVASIAGFRARPEGYYEWARSHTKLILNAEPNAAHAALAQLEAYGPLRCVITQNIDALHIKAGTRNILEVHGHMRQVTCLQCCEITDARPVLEDYLETRAVPHCSVCNGVLKPNVILFGELLPLSVLKQARRETNRCDVMLVAGTSLSVTPASEFPLMAKRAGARLIIVNMEETHLDYLADVTIHADVVDILPQLAAPFTGTQGTALDRVGISHV